MSVMPDRVSENLMAKKNLGCVDQRFERDGVLVVKTPIKDIPYSMTVNVKPLFCFGHSKM